MTYQGYAGGVPRETLEALYGGRVVIAEDGGRRYVIVGDTHV